HRPPEDLIDAWAARFDITEFKSGDVVTFAEEVERRSSVCLLPEAPPDASRALQRGADALGWTSAEVPRWFRYDGRGDGGIRQTMSRTYLPRAQAAGARVVADCRVERLLIRKRRVVGAVCRIGRGRSTVRGTVEAEHVFVCAGAIETPALLQRSGIRGLVGKGLKVHPMIKLAARFPAPLDDLSGIPVHQVREFAPDITLGGSVSRPGYVALALGDSSERGVTRDEHDAAGYYAAICTDG